MAPKTKPPIVRFDNQTVQVESGCVEWTGDASNSGYGRFWIGPAKSAKALAHRWSYEYHVGPIPDGLVIDHLCRNKLCVNPDHLEAVTPAENVRRGTGPTQRSATHWTSTHCRNGHEFTPENTYVNGRERSCVTCKKAQARAHYESERESAKCRAAAWRKANPERAREVARESSARYRARKKEQERGHLIDHRAEEHAAER